jgi:N-acetylmuramoyl-L-alanine amidase
LADDATKALTELDRNSRQETDAKAGRVRTSTLKADDEARNPSEGPQPTRYTRVTGILHWSTADSARVAIDLEQEVNFKSERLQHPSRIYFDLRDTRLAAGLAGKSFDVQAGVLKKIRVAQFERGRSRVVLEVDPQSDYKAFLLPNPNRLIIEIHGTAAAKLPSVQGQTVAQSPAQVPTTIEVRRDVSKLQPAAAQVLPDTQTQLKPASAESKSIQAMAETKPIVKRIVEADDDDEDEPAASKTGHKTGGNKAPVVSKLHAETAAGNGSRARKRRSADGNDDEVATLGAPDIRRENPESATAAPPISNIPVTPNGGHSKRSRSKQDSRILDMREAQPTMAGDRSLIRALGLKIGRIVVDPGHGGHDTGTIGPNGVEEKNIVLDVAKRLGTLLEARMGADVVFTRDDDTFIPLETRTAIANEQQADLFVSIHANSSRDEDARGVETYYLNFTSNAAALEVAARENAASDKSIHELQDLVKKIALKDKIEESREFATDVQRSLHGGLAVKNPGLRDRGVKKAPFVVLIGANMPSILAEISFVSNPTDERKLDTPEYRQRIAESLYKGIAKYVSGLSGVKVAARMAKSDGQ